MSTHSLRRLSVCATILIIIVSALATLAGQSASAAPPRNHTGTAAGSPANGSGYMAVSLSTRTDGGVRVTAW